MTDNSAAESELTHRKVAQDEHEDESKDEAEELKEEAESQESKPKEVSKPKSRQEFDASWKYYWYLFRYYHFKVADTIDLYASAACLWVINLYLRLFMGIGPEPPSTLSDE